MYMYHDGIWAKFHIFKLGEKVWARNHRQRHPRWEKGIISKFFGSRSYLVTLKDGIACKRCVEQIKGMDTGPKVSDTVEEESEGIGGTANGEEDAISIDEEKGEEANDTVVVSNSGLSVGQSQQTSMAGSQS